MDCKLTVAIVDYEMGNIKSIENAINYIGDFNIKITADGDSILQADIIILPGVGAFPDAMQKLKERNLVAVLNEAVITNKTPTLGICLGMQLLFEESDEFVVTKGMGLIKGNVENFSKKKFKVPHIGWEKIKKTRNTNLLNNNDYYYFVHSFFCRPKNKKTILSLTNYQGFNYCSSIHIDNIFATQFHPEKSGKSGLKILSNMKKLI